MSVKDKEHQGRHDENKPLSAILLKRDLHPWKASHLLLFSRSAIQTCVTCTLKRLNRLQQPRPTSKGHRQWNWVLLEHSRGYFTEGEQRTKSSSHPGDEPLEDTLKIQLIKMFTTHPLPLSKENCTFPSISLSGRNLSLKFSIIHLKQYHYQPKAKD